MSTEDVEAREVVGGVAMTNEEQMLATAREMIEARKIHFNCVMAAFELCIAGSPDAPTRPSPEGERSSQEWQDAEKRLITLAVDAPPSPIAEAVRAYAHVHRPGRTISRSWDPDWSPEKIAEAKAVCEDYIRENRETWARLAELAGVEPPDFTRLGARSTGT